jgi:rubrerythrin
MKLDSPTLATYLKGQILAERMCCARMQKITASPHLSDPDRQDLERLIRDEQNHAQWFRECLSVYKTPDGYPGTWPETILEHTEQMKDLTPEEMIVTIALPERYAVRVIRRQAEIFRQAGDTCAADTYEQVLGEERRHVDVTGRILRHFLDGEADGKVRDFYHKAIKSGYRQFHYDFIRSQ